MTRSIHSDEMIALRQWLTAAREAQGISMRALAERLNRPHSFVQRVEEGDRRLDVVEFVEYCEELGLEPLDGLALVRTVRASARD